MHRYTRARIVFRISTLVFSVIAVACGTSNAMSDLSSRSSHAKTVGSENGHARATGKKSQPAAPWSASPWSARRVNKAEVPKELMQEWAKTSSEQKWCAPLTIHESSKRRDSNKEATPGKARGVALDGGWAIAFDRKNGPGINRAGQPCAQCGRGAYGVAGVAMEPAEVFETDRATHRVYDDGSRVSLDEENGVATAFITLPHLPCVYHVWSFLGSDHLSQLIDSARLVSLQENATERVASVRR